MIKNIKIQIQQIKARINIFLYIRDIRLYLPPHKLYRQNNE